MIRFLVSLVSVLAFFFGSASAQVAQPLSASDAETYTRIFDVQEKGQWQEADRLIGQLSDTSLMGHVLYQRYMHPTAYRSSYPELRRWLEAYTDHPGADTIYTLATKRRPSGAARPLQPNPRRWRTKDDDQRWLHPVLKQDYTTSANLAEVKRIENYVRFLNKDDRPTQALNYINASRYRSQLSSAQYDRIRSWIAASYFYNEKTAKAKQIATDVARRNGDVAVLSYWIAGLTHWRDGDYVSAADFFARMAAMPYQEPELRSAAGFWAARGALKTGDLDSVVVNLDIAAQYPYTFYGQLALSQLGRKADFHWTPPTLTEADWQGLAARNERVRRAAALAQAGQYSLAQEELRWAHGELEDPDDPALMALAFDLDLWAAQVTMALASDAERPENYVLQPGLYPVPDFAPNGGYTIDRALLLGLIRQESKFMTDARSRVGAVGLMQLMPRTASYVSGDPSLQYRSGRSRLEDPGYNMQLGQSYVESLLTRYTDGNLFDMALSYNWGPGNLRRFKQSSGITDQLLLLESIPNPEARDFVEHVMTNMWIYRDRFGQPTPTRDAAAAGQAPIYQRLDY
ncbi:MAG: lytic transglycosylase domain-containing protein [Aquisalinus sp.]|nr:lytic transglycosylase domain-containing protein [Aquisalinus sp.]